MTGLLTTGEVCCTYLTRDYYDGFINDRGSPGA